LTKRRFGVRHFIVVGLLLLAASLAPATATADPGRAGLDSASKAVYPGSQSQGGTELGAETAGGGPSPTATPTGTASDAPGLAFTGYSAAAVLGVGLLVLALGIAIRRTGAFRREEITGTDAP